MTASGDDGWAQLSSAAEVDREPTRRPAGRRWITVVTVTLVAVLVLVGAAFLAESVARGFTEDAVAAAVEANLPDGVEGTVDADVAGDWVILQLLSGRMDEVTITSDDVSFDDLPIDRLEVRASGVPIDLKTAVDSIEATATLNQDAVNELLTMPGNDPELVLGDGQVTYGDSTTVFGFDVGYNVTATLEPEGTDVLLTQEGGEVTSSAGDVDAGWLLDRVLADNPLRLCAAEKLPLGVTISRILVTEGNGTLSLAANDFELTGPSLRSRGECPG